MEFKSQNRLLRIVGIVLAAALLITITSRRYTSASTSLGRIVQATTIEDLNTEGINPAAASSSATVTGFVVAPPSFQDGVLGQKQYSVEVPANATMLQVHVFGNEDIRLFARIGQPVTGSGNSFVADYHAANNLTGDQTITITPNDTNQTPLHASTIIFGVVNDGAGALNFTLNATLTTSGNSGGVNVIPINSGTTVSDSIPAATGGVGVLDTNQYSIVVPAGATQLVVSTTSNQNIDLFVRLNQPVTQAGNSFQSDFSSTSSGGNETIVISSFTNPALQAGTYFIGVVNQSTSTAQFNLTATITGGSQGTVVALQSGVAQTGTVAGVPFGSAFLLNPTQFSIQVPAGATQLQIVMTSNNPLDMYVRTGQQVTVGTTTFVFDYAATGNSLTKTITITPTSTPPLQAATYFIALVNNGSNPANFNLTATVTSGNPQNCTFSISPNNQTFPSTGGTGSVTVTTQSGCAWTAISNSSFVTITSGPGGNGSGVVNFTVAPSSSQFTLFGTLTIAGQTFVVTETSAQPACTFTISPTTQNFALGGGTGSVTVTTQSGCNWTAVSNSGFVTVTSGASGTGNGTVNFSVGGTTSARVGTITIAGQTFTVNQNGACSFAISPTSIVASQNVTTSGITVITQPGCQWTAVSNASFATITGGSSGTGNGTVSYFLQSNTGFTRFGTITVAGLTFNITQTGPFGTPSCPSAATVTSIAPQSGAVGTIIDIKGVNFTGITGVRFGNTPATFTVNSDTDLIATVPAGATSGQITLTKPNCGDIAVGAFTVLNCTSTIPVSLPTNVTASAGNNVTIPLTVGDLTNKGVLSYDFLITFDPTQITPQATAVTQSGTLSNSMILATNTNVPGQLRVSGASTSALSGAGTLLNLNFTVITQTTACATLSISNFVFNEGSPCASTTSGQVCRGSANISGAVNYAITPQGVTGVTLTAAGTPSATFTTGHNGVYQFTNLGTGAYTVTPSKTGDINGAIDAFDASLVLRGAAGLVNLTPNQKLAADVSGDGNVTAFDAALIAQFAVGIPNTSNVGKWIFVPASRSYPSLVADQINQNYDAILIGDVSGNWVTALPVAPPGDITQSKVRTRAVTVAPAATITASLPVATGSPSTNVTIPITVSDLTGNGIFSYEFDISYDLNVLTPLNSPVDTTGTLSSAFQIVPNVPTPGHLLVAAFGTNPLAGSGKLLNLVFKVSATHNGTSPLTWQKLQFNEGSPVAGPVSGGFTIGDPCAAVLSPATKSFGVSGGAGSVTISIANGCSVTPTTSASWITLGSLANGILSYTVSSNNTGGVRSGTITVGGKTFNVVQGTSAQATLYGDINHDGKVDISDLLLLANFLAGNTQIDTTAADVMLDGKVDTLDLITLANFIAGNTPGLPQLPVVSQQQVRQDYIAGTSGWFISIDWKDIGSQADGR